MRYGISATLIVAGCIIIVEPLSVHDAESVERTFPVSAPAQSVHVLTRSEARALLFSDRVQWASVGPVSSEPEITGSVTARETPVAADQAEKPHADPGQISQESICYALVAAAREHDLPIGFFIRLIWQESRFSTWALSPVGAQGMAQFMPATASAMGLEDPFDPLQALPVSAKLLRELRLQFGNLGLAAAAYNAGPGRVGDWLKKRRGLPEETRNYVTIITGHKPEQWKSADADNPIASRLSERVPCVQFDDTPEYIPPPRDKPQVVEHAPKAKKALLARVQDSKRKAAAKVADASSKGKDRRGGAKATLASRLMSKGGRKQLVIAVKSSGGKKAASKGVGGPVQIAKVKGAKGSSRVALLANKPKAASGKGKPAGKTRLARAE
jgi:hypothetical protein